MKRRITKAEFEALSPELKAIYIADGEGYKLPLADDDDPDALRRARDREKQDAKEAKAEAKALQVELDKLKGKPTDIATLEASWKEKLAAKETELVARIDKLRKSAADALLNKAAADISASITAKQDHADLILPHIAPRFEVVFDGDVPSLKIKDKQGQLSAMSTEDLQKEIAATPKFASIVVVSKASGGGAPGGGPGGGAGSGTKKFSDLSEPERVELFRSNPTEFNRQFAEAKAAGVVK